MRIDLHPAYILHTRKYRETSLLLEVFSSTHGRVGLVARGARQGKKRQHGLYQAFTPLQLAWTGRGELHTLTDIEAAGPPALLQGERLASGFYINEVLMRLLHRDEPLPELYSVYDRALQGLREQAPLEPVLRHFECQLLQHLGYGLALDHDLHGEHIIQHGHYEIIAEQGLRRCETDEDCQGVVISGDTILALASGHLETPEQLRESKRMMRYLLGLYLGDKPLQSRALFSQWVEQ